jgi:hypothetical protein
MALVADARRSTTRLPPRRRRRLFLALLLPAIFLAAGVTLASSGQQPPGQPVWLAVNDTPFALLFTGTQVGIKRLLPDQRLLFEAPFAADAKDGPATYTFKSYRFYPGHGTLKGYDRQGRVVRGAQGALVFCEVFTRQELVATRLVVTIVQNIADGARLDGGPCPDV